ncbi:hypothetical protein GJ496_000724 [Pomphorhynchus laevis]|nr:hypothetical protein GJ496_000724 [Pomphorhynchus laevis]
MNFLRRTLSTGGREDFDTEKEDNNLPAESTMKRSTSFANTLLNAARDIINSPTPKPLVKPQSTSASYSKQVLAKSRTDPIVISKDTTIRSNSIRMNRISNPISIGKSVYKSETTCVLFVISNSDFNWAAAIQQAIRDSTINEHVKIVQSAFEEIKLIFRSDNECLLSISSSTDKIDNDRQHADVQ